MRRAATVMTLVTAWTTMGAAPLDTVQGDNPLKKVPTGPIGTPQIPPLLLDIQASFDFRKLPMSESKYVAPSSPGSQQLQVPLPSYAMIKPMYGSPEQHALRVYGITYLTPEPISFLSRPFEVAKRKALTVAWDGAFLGDYDRIDMVVGIEGMADLATIAFQKGKVSLVTLQGFQPFATFEGPQGQGASIKETDHHIAVDCGAVTHACMVTFSQNGKVTKSPFFTLASPTLLPTPSGQRRVYLRMTWPASEASSVHTYDFRRVTISGDLLGGG